MKIQVRLSILTATFLLLPAVLASTCLAKEPATPAPNRKPVKFPGIVVDLQNGWLDLEGTIRVNDGFLELIACSSGTKEHESIVAVDARPMHIHAALLLLGANNGHPALRKPVDEEMLRWVNVPPQGDPIDVFLVLNNEEGKPVPRPISDFVVRSNERVDEIGEAQPSSQPESKRNEGQAVRLPHTFLFAGSHLMDNGDGPRRYLADESGDVISIATFGDEVLSLPFRQSQANDALMWKADAKTLPKVGTKVTLRLRPKAKLAKPK